MKTKKAARRRKKSAAARLRPFWIVLVLLVFAGLLGGYYLASWPAFFPKGVSVSGNERISSHAIALEAAIDRRRNLWLQNMGAAAARVAAIPDIGQVTIHRGLPASITIAVTERIPYAIVRTPQGRLVVDRQLRVLDAASRPTLPVFALTVKPRPPGAFLKDERLLRLRDDFDRLSGAHVAIANLRYDRFGDLVATTPRRIEILLGDDQYLAAKVPLIGPILSQTGARKLAAIDLRAPSTPVVLYRR